MNRQEQRALRQIEKNLTIEDPGLAELLRTHGMSRWVRICRRAAWSAVSLALLGIVLGDAVLLVSTGLVASGAVLLGRYLR